MSDLPRHVAVIMDGNGRWAQSRGLPRLAGHRAGMENVRTVLRACADYGIEYLTIYAFSTENWRRPVDEVMGLMRLLAEGVRRETAQLHKNGVRIVHLGSLDGVPDRLARAISQAVELTMDNQRITLNVAFNYGGRAEIIQAAQAMLREGLDPETVDEATFASHLYTSGQPDPDLIVRTAGEMRLSNFLIWQAAYAEYYSTPAYWPDFGTEELSRALDAYAQRERRFGRVKP